MIRRNSKENGIAWARALVVAGAAVAFALLLPGLALASNGTPNLDPSGGTTGTPYLFAAKGVAQSLEPGAPNGSTGTATGSLTIFQDPNNGGGAYTAAGVWDSDGDGTTDGTLQCTGEVGQGRFGLACIGETDQGEDIYLIINGQAKANPKTQKVSLKKCAGTAFTKSFLLKLVFAAEQQ